MELSLLTISTLALLVSAFTNSISTGLTTALLIQILQTMIFDKTYYPGFLHSRSLPEWSPGLAPFFADAFVKCFWSALLFALVGERFSRALRIPPLLGYTPNGNVFSNEYKAKIESIAGPVESLKPHSGIVRFWLVFSIIMAGYAIYEPFIPHFPRWASATVLAVLICCAWIFFYFLFRHRENKRTVLFYSSDPNKEVAVIAFHLAWAQLVYVATDASFQLIDCDRPYWHQGSSWPGCPLYAGEQWYFWLSLIVGGVLLIWAGVLDQLMSARRARPNQPAGVAQKKQQ